MLGRDNIVMTQVLNIGGVMMRIVLFFDQIQAGAGGKEQAQTPLSVERGGVGAFLTLQPYINNVPATVVATTYSGTDFFRTHREHVIEKMIGLLRKVKADVLLCGPCYNYEPYAEMAVQLASAVQTPVVRDAAPRRRRFFRGWLCAGGHCFHAGCRRFG